MNVDQIFVNATSWASEFSAQGWVTTALLPAKILNGHIMRMNLSMRAYNLKKQKEKQK